MEGQAAQTREMDYRREKKKHSQTPRQTSSTLSPPDVSRSPPTHTPSPPDSSLTLSYLHIPTHSPTPRWLSRATLTHLQTPTTLFLLQNLKTHIRSPSDPRDPCSISSFPPRGTLPALRPQRPTLVHRHTLTRLTLFPSRLLRTQSLLQIPKDHVTTTIPH